MLVSFSLVRVPIPGVNEPHYLGKAKHYWNPTWCDDDFFLESSNPHVVFYYTFGWLTRSLSLNDVAWFGRIFGLIPLAIGWTALGKRICGSQELSIVALGFFLMLHAAGNWSGEWLVGGIESKTIAYGFLFWSIAEAMSLRILPAGLLAGLAISFHPIIGVWGSLAALLGTVGLLFSRDRRQVWTGAPPAMSWGIAAAFFILAAVPGLTPALRLVSDGDPADVLTATHLQVAHRLAHHLDPMMFLKTSHRFFVMLLIVWGLLLSTEKSTRLEVKWWRLLVCASLLSAFVGVLIAWGPRPIKTMTGYEWRMSALKFYPYRLADILLPVSVSFSAAISCAAALRAKLQRPLLRSSVLTLLTVICLVIALQMPGSDRNSSNMSAATEADWISAAQWIDENTAKTDLIYSLENQWAVKWFANRAEFVNYKDCPQDTQGILEWNDRLWTISKWKTKATQDSLITLPELAELHTATGIDWIIFGKYWKVDVEPDYKNQHFRIYRTAQ